VVRCRTCDRDVAGSKPTNGCCVPMPTQRAIPPGSVNEYQRKLGSKRARDLRIVFFSFESNLESNRPYTTQAVTQPNGLQVYRTRRTACYTYSEYLIHQYFVFVTNENDVRTTELRTEYLFTAFQFSHKTRQTMLLYAYFTPKVYLKRKFNHHQSFLYE